MRRAQMVEQTCAHSHNAGPPRTLLFSRYRSSGVLDVHAPTALGSLRSIRQPDRPIEVNERCAADASHESARAANEKGGQGPRAEREGGRTSHEPRVREVGHGEGATHRAVVQRSARQDEIGRSSGRIDHPNDAEEELLCELTHRRVLMCILQQQSVDLDEVVRRLRSFARIRATAWHTAAAP